jgi:hypothetical protein
MHATKMNFTRFIAYILSSVNLERPNKYDGEASVATLQAVWSAEVGWS